jgi:pimeloyl-ACP methyl ester carboxylesterase
MSTITAKDGTQIYYKDWDTGQAVVFSHGWPFSAVGTTTPRCWVYRDPAGRAGSEPARATT